MSSEMPETIYCWDKRERYAYTRSDLYDAALEEVERLRALLRAVRTDELWDGLEVEVYIADDYSDDPMGALGKWMRDRDALLSTTSTDTGEAE